MDLLQIVGWVVCGLVIGILARFLVRANGPIDQAAPVVLSVLGSVIGGATGYMLGASNGLWDLAGWILWVFGAVVLLSGYYYVTGRRSA
jgi:uncharacterized membrane protein YeaQ/YmgE (transglycosylase-associated protein family)